MKEAAATTTSLLQHLEANPDALLEVSNPSGTNAINLSLLRKAKCIRGKNLCF
jgi:hypothetical protein